MTKTFRTVTECSVAFLALAVGSAAWSQPLPETATACASGDLLCLDQGWADNQRSWWYTTSQGSRLLPLSWALALKTADGQGAMFGQPHLQLLGYLANPVSQDNPDGLPVGFVVDHDPRRSADLMCDTFPETCRSRTMREPWLGLNCSACHTAEVTHDGRTLRIDGAPAAADFNALVVGTENALRATLDDVDRFSAFAREVIGSTEDWERTSSLAVQMSEQIDWMEKLRRINHGDVAPGPARLDAQGHILTKVSAINGADDPSTAFASDAPASYPFIWNTYQQGKLQWNGIAGEVIKIPIRGNVTDIGALVRNTSEVIGVFAHIDANRGYAGLGYDSSVRVREMIGLERLLSSLQSPQWPEDVLGPIDTELAARGGELFEQKCRSCHAHLAPTDIRTPANDRMMSLNRAGTDVFLACNTYLRRTAAGNMRGQRTFGFVGDKIRSEDSTHLMLVNAAVGAIFGKFDELVSSLFEQIEPEPEEGMMAMAMVNGVPGEVLPGVVDPEKKRRAERCLNADSDLLAYKSRPLNGIWATAPYLHNGSVPTLYDLLLPPVARNFQPDPQFFPSLPGPTGPFRSESFAVGTGLIDTEKVGVMASGGADDWIFTVRDTAGNIIPGNSNAGHDYGNAALTDEDRFALIEYMKGL
ncbi:hypothetical protein ILP92_04170 [Maribius pontilimi]|uniref:Cytochrome c domain-containing protein n=1 Tax=Palleronia pontilimi TaxID=1964209 RepID=A0A934MBQ4_9RHOB|nr:di-heme-cytochrome C peroxidase [Palleronia pontilimi]MBJ3761943.1 hypothetical protein [Palleronia pontilimi]